MPTPVAVAPVPPPAPAPVKPVAPPPPNGAKGKVAPPAPDAAAPAVDADPVLWEGKVDGQMVKVKKSEADRLLSKGKFADRATQEAKEAIKRAKQVAEKVEADAAAARERAKSDTDAWMREHGIDPDEWAKSKLEKKVEEGKMTAEQRRALELEQENKRLRSEQEKLAKQHEAERTQQVTSQLQKRIENELHAAAQRANMDVNADSFYAVYESFREAFELGLLPVDANGLLPHHADRIVEEAMARLDTVQKNLREHALKLNGQALEDYLGKEVADKLMTHRLEKIRSQRPGYVPGAPASKPAPAPTTRPSSYISPAELDAQVKKLGAKF